MGIRPPAPDTWHLAAPVSVKRRRSKESTAGYPRGRQEAVAAFGQQRADLGVGALPVTAVAVGFDVVAVDHEVVGSGQDIAGGIQHG